MRRVIAATLVGSGLYFAFQTTLEFLLPIHPFYQPPSATAVSPFAHGGLVFWALTSALFGLLYAAVLSAPWILPSLPAIAARVSLPSSSVPKVQTPQLDSRSRARNNGS